MSGGEPTVRKDDVIKLAEKHVSQCFHLFTNGTLVDDDFVKEMKRVGNITLAFSIEGFEEATDKRRGKGVFKKVMDAMDRMREAGLIFGVSTTYCSTTQNWLVKNLSMLVDGVTFGWLTYIPIGCRFEMMATPEQRAYMAAKNILKFRKTKPIFLAILNDLLHPTDVLQWCGIYILTPMGMLSLVHLSIMPLAT